MKGKTKLDNLRRYLLYLTAYYPKTNDSNRLKILAGMCCLQTT